MGIRRLLAAAVFSVFGLGGGGEPVPQPSAPTASQAAHSRLDAYRSDGQYPTRTTAFVAPKPAEVLSAYVAPSAPQKPDAAPQPNLVNRVVARVCDSVAEKNYPGSRLAVFDEGDNPARGQIRTICALRENGVGMVAASVPAGRNASTLDMFTPAVNPYARGPSL